MAEAVCQLEDGEYELTLGGASLLEPGLQRQVLDGGGVGRCGRQVVDGRSRVRFASPSVPV